MTDQEYIASVSRLRNAIARAIHGFFRNEEDTSDVVQDVMMWLWIKRSEIDFGRVEALATTMARNRAVSILRKRSHVTSEPVESNHSVSQRNASWTIEENENRRLIDAALDSLTNTERHIFRLRHEAEMSTGQVAAVLGINERTVSATLSKARRKMLEQIKNNI